MPATGRTARAHGAEYYFSTVDPKVYGSDTKVPHNVTGLIGVMAGAHSDLATGAMQVHWAMALAAGVGTFLTAAYFLWYFQQGFLGPANPQRPDP